MSIVKDYDDGGGRGKTFTPVCDCCGQALDPCGTWSGARASIIQQGWTTQKGDDGNWENICPDCLEK